MLRLRSRYVLEHRKHRKEGTRGGNMCRANDEEAIAALLFNVCNRIYLYIYIYIYIYMFSLQYLHHSTFILNDFSSYTTIETLRKILSFQALLRGTRDSIDMKIADYVSDDSL
jgi:hypothetical protein